MASAIANRAIAFTVKDFTPALIITVNSTVFVATLFVFRTVSCVSALWKIYRKRLCVKNLHFVIFISIDLFLIVFDLLFSLFDNFTALEKIFELINKVIHPKFQVCSGFKHILCL